MIRKYEDVVPEEPDYHRKCCASSIVICFQNLILRVVGHEPRKQGNDGVRQQWDDGAGGAPFL